MTTLQIPEEIIKQAKTKALAHINAVKTMIETDGDWDDCQANPFDAWLTVENYDLNVVGDNEKEDDPLTWTVSLYTGKTNAEGYWETDTSNYVSVDVPSELQSVQVPKVALEEVDALKLELTEDEASDVLHSQGDAKFVFDLETLGRHADKEGNVNMLVTTHSHETD